MATSENKGKPVIKVLGLHKYFGDVHVIKGVDLDIRSGEVIAIMGPSGGGKSTFLRCLNFLEESSAGTIEVAGIHVDAAGSKDQWQKDVQAIRRQAAMVFQEFNLFQHMTIVENVIVGAIKVKKVPKKHAMDTAEMLLTSAGLWRRRDAYPSQLSTGEQQQVAIARSLCMEPKALLFDDPTSALDPLLVSDLAETIKQLARDGMAIIVVTNEPYFARSIADLIVFMDGGIWLEAAAPTDLFENPQKEPTRRFLEQVYLKDISTTA